jgi:hypothetical protein
LAAFTAAAEEEEDSMEAVAAMVAVATDKRRD